MLANSIRRNPSPKRLEGLGDRLLTSEWPDLPEIANADNYLRESALRCGIPVHAILTLSRRVQIPLSGART